MIGRKVRKNRVIREALRKCNVRQYEVAERLGITEACLSVRLRKDITPEDELMLISLITTIASEKEREEAEA